MVGRADTPYERVRQKPEPDRQRQEPVHQKPEPDRQRPEPVHQKPEPILLVLSRHSYRVFRKYCPIERLRKVSGVGIYSLKVRQYFSIATMLEQYKCRLSCVVRRMRNSPYSSGGAF